MAKKGPAPKKVAPVVIKETVAQKIDDTQEDDKIIPKMNRATTVTKIVVGHDRFHSHFDKTTPPFDDALLKVEFLVIHSASDPFGKKYLAKRLPEVVSANEKKTYLDKIQECDNKTKLKKGETPLIDDFVGLSKKTWKRSNSIKLAESGSLSEISWLDYVIDIDETKKLSEQGLERYIRAQNGSLQPSQLKEVIELFSKKGIELNSDTDSDRETKKLILTKPVVHKLEPNNFFGESVAHMKFVAPADCNSSYFLYQFFIQYGSEFAYIDLDINDIHLKRRSYWLTPGKEYIAEIVPILPSAGSMEKAWQFQIEHGYFSGGAQSLALLWPLFSFMFPSGRIIALDSFANYYIDDDDLDRLSCIEKNKVKDQAEIDEFNLLYIKNGFKENDFALLVREA